MVKPNLGALDTWRILVQNWVAFINFLMIAYLYFDRAGFSWWYFAAVPFALGFFVFYIRRVFPQNQEYGFTRSESMRKLFRDVEEIKSRLNE